MLFGNSCLSRVDILSALNPRGFKTSKVFTHYNGFCIGTCVAMKQSLSRRFSLAIIGVVAVIVIGFTVVLVWDNVKLLETELNQRLSLASDLAALTLALPLWELNFAQIKDVAEALFKDRDMVYVNIIDIYDKALATKIRPSLAQEKWEFFEQSPRFMARSHKIRYTGNDVGTVQLAVSKEGIQQALQARMIWITILMLCLMIAISLTSIALTRRYILSPLSTLVASATAIADGDVNVSLHTPLALKHPNDEIGILTQVFQRMVTYLSEMATAATQISTGDLRQMIAPLSERDVLGMAFHRMTNYLKRLATAATTIAGGDLQQDIQPEMEHDVLGNAFHKMAMQLREDFEKIQQEVAERTRAQEALQKLNEELEQRVQERTLDLAAAYEEIRLLNEQLKEENVRLGAELEVTRRLQQMLLPSPHELQAIPGLEIAAYMAPADEVGGDYYDVLQHNGRIKIGIGDVTGHGLESGVVMVMTQAIVRALLISGETDPVRFLDTLNRTLYRNVRRMGTDKNLTLALLDYAAGDMRLSGQHEAMLVVRDGGTVEVVDTIDLGFPVALTDEIADFIQHTTVRLQPGDGVVLYTDGITEAENMAGQQYGLARLCMLVSQHWAAPAEVIKERVVTDVRQHMGTQCVYDDITLVVVKRR
jgi:serine phosphatase RsbU (regulator of sigma subunit)/HAMP domain-containing protein